MFRAQAAVATFAVMAFLTASAVEPLELRIDFARTNGTWRALHGINRGPLIAGGMIEIIEAQRALNIPFTRLHDSHWPTVDVVDIHAVFPDFTRDPAQAESYDFTRTDKYLAAVRKTGAQIVYRLGESIEHDDIKRNVHPPPDAKKWAQICLGIIRHYNEGWANGARHDIRYWEIWNEPENRPACWTGTDEQFLALYATAAREIKSRFPKLKVGGPGFGYTGEVRRENFRAGGLMTNFLAFCRRASLPVDFLSWHCYTDDPHELVVRARGIRSLLDAHGFTNAESHLNEWNYLPGKTWAPISKTRGTPESRRIFYGEMAGAPGAAFVAAALMALQDAPVDAANLFHGETGPFGLFDIHGAPEKSYFAVRAFAEFLKTPRRVRVEETGRIHTAAGLNDAGTEAAILVSNLAEPQSSLRVACANLPWPGPLRGNVRVIDGANDFSAVTDAKFSDDGVHFTLRRPAVALIWLRPATD
ncbi:MAG TPA: hypothetical protein VGF13_07080 [Verrucomicrobiae bacterium]